MTFQCLVALGITVGARPGLLEWVPTSLSQRPESVTDGADVQEEASLQKCARQRLPPVWLIMATPWISVALWEAFTSHFLPLSSRTLLLSVSASLCPWPKPWKTADLLRESRHPGVTRQPHGSPFLPPSGVRTPETDHGFHYFSSLYVS